MGVTLEEIAETVGVSKATVSRALRNDRLIHSDTRSRILETAARMGYERSAKKPRKSARQQVRLLFLLPPRADAMGNYVFQRYLRGIARATGELGCLLSVEEISEGSTGRLDQRVHLPREIRAGAVDAVIVASRHLAADIEALVKILPVVSIQWNHGGAQSDLVSAFNVEGIEELVGLMVERGRRKLAWVGYEYKPQASFVSERRAGFVKRCLDLGLEVSGERMFAEVKALKEAGGIARLRELGVTGVVCVNDVVGNMVAEMALIAGLRVPEDLSITGFDADSEPLANGKMLTSYDPCFLEVSRQAVYVALQRLKDPGAPRGIHQWEGRVRIGGSI